MHPAAAGRTRTGSVRDPLVGGILAPACHQIEPERRQAAPPTGLLLSVGLLSGGYGEDELRAAGAFRVYRDPAELLISLDELGIVLAA